MTCDPGHVPNPPDVEGAVREPSRRANVHGPQQTYEAAPHKNTLGLWTLAEDTASREFGLKKPGASTTEVAQGRAKGRRGSAAGGRSGTRFAVKDAAGLQTFEAWATVAVKLDEACRYTPEVRPKTKAGGAVMDLRSATLQTRLVIPPALMRATRW